MVDMALVSGLVGTLKTAMDIGQTLKEINDLSQVRDKVIEMQGLILNAQSSAMTAQTQLFEVLHENSELKKKVSSVDEWKTTADRYRLVDFGAGTFAYELKEEAANGEPIHRLCPVCFGKQSRSYLQFQGVTSSRQDLFRCLPCGQDYFFGTKQVVSHPRVNRKPTSSWLD
ncbi:hypothetical protein QO004_004105 [Rhizobium mesoamericanum]|uniref:hypothetical protein n=1 Tax=Rhizobium mesoamericanum TaxID=1079800 RepID=UPI0027894A50|nr:hypothetical protein [Rhizobium mesoamericanum]MDQ0562300.1 hypothetical protein [Rhizobium mesoamericanum]